jgi:hypothetical protein
MTGDNMEIVNPNTGGKKFMVDADNKVIDNHECVFHGDHSKGLDVDDTCTICGKTLGDLISEEFNPLQPKIPIIIDSKENNDEHDA